MPSPLCSRLDRSPMSVYLKRRLTSPLSLNTGGKGGLAMFKVGGAYGIRTRDLRLERALVGVAMRRGASGFVSDYRRY